MVTVLPLCVHRSFDKIYFNGSSLSIAKGLPVVNPRISISSYKSCSGSSVSTGISNSNGASVNNTGAACNNGWFFFCKKLASHNNVFLDFPVKRKAPTLTSMFSCSIVILVRSIKSWSCRYGPLFFLSSKNFSTISCCKLFM